MAGTVDMSIIKHLMNLALVLFLPSVFLLIVGCLTHGYLYTSGVVLALFLAFVSTPVLRKNIRQKLYVSIVVFPLLLAVTSPILTPYSHSQQDMDSLTWNLLGLDILGRDMFSRLLYANRSSFIVAGAGSFLASFIVLLFAFLLSTLKGFWKSTLNMFLQAFLSFPLILLFLLGASLGDVLFDTSGPLFMIMLVALTLWAESAKMTQARIEDLAHAEFIQAGALAGLNKSQIFIREILPNLKPLLVVNFLLIFIHAILMEAILGFMGIGLKVGEPNLGRMIYAGLNAPSQEPVTFFSALGILLYWIFAMRSLINRIDQKRRFRNVLVFRSLNEQ